jgi:hypothetical protein
MARHNTNKPSNVYNFNNYKQRTRIMKAVPWLSLIIASVALLKAYNVI